jgi:outer membrane protein TolC
MNGISENTACLVRCGTAAFLALCLAGTAAAQDGAVGITLKEAIRMAAEKNLDVKAELYNPAIAESDIRRNRAIYDPNLTALTNYSESTSANPTQASAALGGNNINKMKAFDLNAGISKLTPYGGTIGLAFNNSWLRNEFSATTSEYFQNSLTFNISQPLLKNFGRETTELNISLARYNKDSSLEQFRTKLTGVITQVRTEYFNLYSLREDLEVKKTSLALAQKILNETGARIKAGVLPAMENLNAEFNVSTRERAVIDAERALRDKRDVLRTLLQVDTAGVIDPVDSPNTSVYEINEEEAIRSALETRPELKQFRENLKAADLQERVTRHQVMPDLSLNASGGLGGINRDYGKQWEGLAKADYPVWSIGLTFSYPLGNNAAENDYIKSKLKAEQLRAQIRSQEDAIADEVRSAIRAVQSGYKQIDVTRRGSAYAEEVLNAYIKKAAVGLATTKDVFDVQNNLIAAKGAEIQAKAGYDNALTQYWKATGELLGREGIRIDGKQADELYGRAR